MISAAAGLVVGIGILLVEGFALFLMVLGAIDLWGHIQSKRTTAK